MTMKVVRWFLFVCFCALIVVSIFILATPKEIIGKVDDLNVGFDLKIEEKNFDYDPVEPWEVRVNYKLDDGTVTNVAEWSLPFWQRLCRVESVQTREFDQLERELFLTVKTETESRLLLGAILFSVIFLPTSYGLLKIYVR